MALEALMTRTSSTLLLWSPRILGIAVSCFIGLFALDAFSDGAPMREAMTAFVIHLLPALALLAIVAISWRWEWVGGTAFVALAAVYALTMARGRLDWMLVISGPLLVVGALFFWSWHHHAELHRVG
jgi:hypothetical protein